MRGKMLAAAAAVAMMGLGSGALAQSAAPLSLARATSATAESQADSELRGGFIIPTVVVIALIALIYVLTKDGDSESP